MKSLDTYRQTFEQVKKRHRWSNGNAVLRFAALSLAGVPHPDPAEAMDRASETLREKSGFWSSLKSPVRTVLAAMILRRGLDPAKAHDAMERTVGDFRRHNLGGYGLYPKLAALILTFRHGPETPVVVLERLRAIHTAWVRDHFWLTGDDDLPMAALHASRNESVEALTARLEDIYKGLVKAGFGRGNALQLASHILGVKPWDGSRAAERFSEVAAALEKTGITIRRPHYDEVALLSLTGEPADRAAKEVTAARDVLWDDVGWTARELAFPLAVGCFLGELAPGPDSREVHDIASAKQVMDILAAQAAVVAACCIV